MSVVKTMVVLFVVLLTTNAAHAGNGEHTFYLIYCDAPNYKKCAPIGVSTLIVNPRTGTVMKETVYFGGSMPTAAGFDRCNVVDEKNFVCENYVEGQVASRWSLMDGKDFEYELYSLSPYYHKEEFNYGYFVTPMQYYRRKLMGTWDK